MPRAPKFCGRSGCTERVVGRTYCVDHTPQAWSGPNYRAGSWAWSRLRGQVLEEEPLCRDCSCNPSTEAGHIVARSLGGMDTRDNLKGQCRPCNMAQMRRDRGFDRDVADLTLDNM